jgi:DNA-binding LytR/AlgR family response regulator
MKKKILVIEDEKMVRENISFLLKEEGYTVFACKNGNEGIEKAGEEIPDLIVCDIMMHGKNGYDVLKELSKDNSTKTIPFIFLTAKVDKEDIRTGMNLGADDYLFKPFDADDLLESIETRLKRVESFKADKNEEKEEDRVQKYSMDDKIFIQINNKAHLINISEIEFVEAEKQYTSLKMTDGKSYLLRKSISLWEKLLPEKKFLRIHRSTIINIDYLLKMETWYNSSYLIYLKNIQKPFVISRRYSIKLRGKLFK